MLKLASRKPGKPIIT